MDAATRIGQGWLTDGTRLVKLIDYGLDLRNFMNAAEEYERLKNCGLVHHENQLNSHRYVGPPERRPDGSTQFKVLPLFQVEPKPNMEIRATDGERYILPYDFKGGWFDVVSPKGVRLIQ